MGVYTYQTEVTTTIPPAKFFRAFILDANRLYPKISPHEVEIQVLEGDGGPGTVKKLTFGHGSHVKYMKHKIETIDEETLTYKYSVIEGEPLSEFIDEIVREIKIEAAADGGSVLKSSSRYHTKGDYQINEEKLKAGEEKGLGLLKAAENYLLGHPAEYN